MAILHVIKKHNWNSTVVWMCEGKIYGSSLWLTSHTEHLWKTLRSRRLRLELKNLSFLRLWKTRFNTNNKGKVKNKRHVRKLFRRSIHLQTCFFLWTQRRHWRKKPLFVVMVVWFCLSARPVRITLCSRCRSSEGLRWGLSSPPPEFSLPLSPALCFCHLQRFFHWGGGTEKKSSSAVSFSPLFGCFLSLHYFQGSAQPKMNVLSWFIHPHVLPNLNEFLFFFSGTQKMDIRKIS